MPRDKDNKDEACSNSSSSSPIDYLGTIAIFALVGVLVCHFLGPKAACKTAVSAAVSAGVGALVGAGVGSNVIGSLTGNLAGTLVDNVVGNEINDSKATAVAERPKTLS